MPQPGHDPYNLMPLTINATTNGRVLSLYVSMRTAINVNKDTTNWSMSQPGHDPHDHNAVNYQRQSINWSMSQPGQIHTTTMPLTINTTTNGRDLSCMFHPEQLMMSAWTLAINWSMPQPGHDPHDYNAVNYQHHYQWARSQLVCFNKNSYRCRNCLLFHVVTWD